MSRHKHNHKNMYQDLGIAALSVFVALLIAQSGAFERFITTIGELRLLGSFFAGTLFTSIFTVIPATIVLGELAQANSAWTVAFTGALGAVAGDYIIFRFVRDRFSIDILQLLHQHGYKRVRRIIQLRSSRWVLGALGMLIIASPLPDELGIALLGLSKAKKRFVLPLSFAANFFGILAIGLAAKTLT